MIKHVGKLFCSFRTAEGGVTAIEYGLIAGAMGIATALGMTTLRPAVMTLFESVVTSFSG